MNGNDTNLQNACGCCAGVTVQSPAPVFNRPGLSAIGYRIGGHGEILTSLKARLSSQDFPALAALRTRDTDDFSIALLDASAAMADVLGFYQERIANESYLRTASERLSLVEQARLIGYRLRPGVAAETCLAFQMEETPGAPEKLQLPIGVQVQSVPGQDEKPQTFETVEAIEARPVWNALRPAQSHVYLPASGRTDLYLSGTALGLRVGDGLLFIGDEYLSGANTSRWQFRLISSMSIDADTQRTRVSWNGQLTPDTPALNPQVHVFRKKAAVFGHNAPMWETMPADFRSNYPKPVGYVSDWPGYTISPAANAVDLDAVYADVVVDSSQRRSFAVLVMGTWAAPFKVNVTGEVSRSAFAMAAKITRVTLTGTAYATFQNSVRETAVYIASEQLTLAEAPLTSAIAGDQILLDRKIEGLEPGRTLIVSGRVTATNAEMAETAILKQVTAVGNVSRLDLKQSLQYSYQRDSVVVHANVARATHGATVHQILGSGAARKTHQRFALRHTPLTFTGADNETGAASTLEVRVNDIRWREMPTLYGTSTEDRVYVQRQGDAGASEIQFGDGIRGARLPSGQENVRAVYRKGMGAAGNLKAGQLSQLLTRPLGLKGVTNPLPSSGGVDADSSEHARRNMPLGVRTLGRVVSLRDYEDFARAYTGITRAQASVLDTRNGRTVFLTLAGIDGAQPGPTDPTLVKLLKAIKQGGDPFVRCEARAYVKASFKLALRVRRHPDHDITRVLADVEAALRAAFSFDARDFGQIVARSGIIAVVQNVAGVEGVDLDRFYRGMTMTLEEHLAPAPASVSAAGIITPAELLLLDSGPLDYLEEMP